MTSITGRCIEDHDLAEFSYKHWNTGLFGDGYGGHHFTVKPLSTYLPGQKDLPQSVIEFSNKTTALVALEISQKWEGVSLVKWWRIIYIHPDLVPILEAETGEKLRDIPIGEHERFSHEEE